MRFAFKAEPVSSITCTVEYGMTSSKVPSGNGSAAKLTLAISLRGGYL